MNCPNCNGEMWDNTAPGAKKNPKGPDYKCKDKNCIDPTTGQTSAIWLPKGSKIVKSASPQPVQQPTNDIKERSMMMSYAKDLVVAEIAGGTPPPESVKQTIAYYRELWQEFKNPQNMKNESL